LLPDDVISPLLDRVERQWQSADPEHKNHASQNESPADVFVHSAASSQGNLPSLQATCNLGIGVSSLENPERCKKHK